MHDAMAGDEGEAMSHNIYEGDDALAVAAGIVIALLLTGAAGVTYLVNWKLFL